MTCEACGRGIGPNQLGAAAYCAGRMRKWCFSCLENDPTALNEYYYAMTQRGNERIDEAQDG
jgi:hypothetical protein